MFEGPVHKRKSLMKTPLRNLFNRYRKHIHENNANLFKK